MQDISSTTLDALAATALAGLVWESAKAYRAACPPIPELRNAKPGDREMLQHLVDTDITVAIPAVFAALVASLFLKSWWPIVITAVALGATAAYHHSILAD